MTSAPRYASARLQLMASNIRQPLSYDLSEETFRRLRMRRIDTCTNRDTQGSRHTIIIDATPIIRIRRIRIRIRIKCTRPSNTCLRGLTRTLARRRGSAAPRCTRTIGWITSHCKINGHFSIENHRFSGENSPLSLHFQYKIGNNLAFIL